MLRVVSTPLAVTTRIRWKLPTLSPDHVIEFSQHSRATEAKWMRFLSSPVSPDSQSSAGCVTIVLGDARVFRCLRVVRVQKPWQHAHCLARPPSVNFLLATHYLWISRMPGSDQDSSWFLPRRSRYSMVPKSFLPTSRCLWN